MQLSGFEISPAKQLQMLKVLKLMGKDYLKQSDELKFLLAPIFCKSEEQQIQFYRLFDTYINEIKEPLKEPESIASISKPWYQNIWFWLFAFLLLLALIISQIIPQSIKEPKLSIRKEPQSIKIGDTLHIVNQSENLHIHHKLAYFFEDAKGKILETDTVKGKCDWKFKVTEAGENPVTVSLEMVEEELKNNPSKVIHKLDILCNNPPQISKGNWVDSTRVNEPLSFEVLLNDDRTYEYNWFKDDQLLPDSSSTLKHKFQQAGYFVLTAKATLTNGLGRCETILKDTIVVTRDKEIVQLEHKPLVKDHQSKAFFNSNWWLFLLLFSLIPLYAWYNKWKQQAQKEIRPHKEDFHQIFEAPDRPPYSIPFRAMNHVVKVGKNLFEFANTLRQRQEALRLEADIEKSLHATIEKGGFPEISFKSTTQPTEYLFLIDHQSNDSLQSRLFEYLVDFLKSHDVHVEQYFYHRKPYSLWKKDEKEALTLSQLRRLYPHYRLVIMGDAHRFLKEYGPDPQALNENYQREITAWEHRCLLTPIPPCSWTYKEAGLYRQMPVFPADTKGIEMAFDSLQNTREEVYKMPFNNWQEILLQNRKQDNDVNYRKWRKLETLKDYLKDHPELWLWLKALSVHPVISWELTLAIGHALEEKGVIVNYNNLLLLARIPWLQEGSFPPKLRLQLLDNLNDESKKLARLTVKKELEALEELTKNSFVNFEVQTGLAVQNFLLAPDIVEHQAAISALIKGGEPIIGNYRYKELDQQIRKYQIQQGEKEGGLQVFLDKANEAAKKEPFDIFKPFPYVTAFVSLLFLALLTASLLLNGSDALKNFVFGTSNIDLKENPPKETFFVIEKIVSPNEAAILNNKAVDISMEKGMDSMVGYYLHQAISKKDAYPLGELNKSKYHYNKGVDAYKVHFEFTHIIIDLWLNEAYSEFRLAQKHPDIVLDSQHGMGLVEFYKDERARAETVYKEIISVDSTYFDALSVQPNLKNLLSAPFYPCENIDCGENGKCVEGECECINGYTGDRCQNPPDPCLNIDCGDNADCIEGKCKCKNGYTGEKCQTLMKSIINNNIILLDRFSRRPDTVLILVEFPDSAFTLVKFEEEYDDLEGNTLVFYFTFEDSNLGEEEPYELIYSLHLSNIKDPEVPIIFRQIEDNSSLDPCNNIDCGENGYCVDGKCECVNGYTGERCEIPPDLCLNVDCGENGKCNDGKCDCINNYTGERCQIPPGPYVQLITGKIVDLKNKGIEGVEIRLDSTGDSKYTDKDGYFEFNGKFTIAEPVYSFELYKEGYIPVGNTHQKKPIFIKGNMENILMKEDIEKYLWITVVDAESSKFLKDVEIDILGKQEKTNKSGKAKFDLSGLGKNTVNASFIKKCYKNELTQINTKGEEIIKLINNCIDQDPKPQLPQEDLTTDIVGKYMVKSQFLNFNMGLDLDREYEIEIKKKNNNTITVLDKVFIIEFDISYEIGLIKSENKILFDIPKQTDINQTVKGTGHSTHSAHGEFLKQTGEINFSYVVSDESANMKYNIVGYKKE